MTIETFTKTYRQIPMTAKELRNQQLRLVNLEIPRIEKEMRWEALEILLQQKREEMMEDDFMPFPWTTC